MAIDGVDTGKFTVARVPGRKPASREQQHTPADTVVEERNVKDDEPGDHKQSSPQSWQSAGLNHNRHNQECRPGDCCLSSMPGRDPADDSLAFMLSS